MQKKLIAVAVGAFGYGALLSWAVTADRFEQQLKADDETINVLRTRLRTLKREQFVQNNTYVTQHIPAGVGTEGYGIRLDPDDSGPTIVQDGDGTLRTEELQGENPRRDETSEVDETGGEEEEEGIIPEGETPEETRSNLQSLIDQYTANPDDRDTFVNLAHQEVVQTNTPPFVIPKDKFAWDEEEGDEYDKVTVTYYPHARVVLDEEDEVMEDIAHVLGWRNLSRFGDESGDADVVFIRNRQMRTDFEVVKDEESPLPLHVKYGMGKDEFEVNKAAGTLRLRDEDT